MRKLIILKSVLLLLVVFGFQSVGHAQKPQLGEIYITNDVEAFNKNEDRVGVSVLFTLFKDGNVVRSSELSLNGFPGAYTALWSNLPIGGYELHCESLGFGKLVRKIAVGLNERAQFTLKTLPPKDEVQGAGPTLFELQRKIALLEKQNAELLARLAALEKAK